MVRRCDAISASICYEMDAAPLGLGLFVTYCGVLRKRRTGDLDI